MPIYEYQCASCDNRFEKLRPISAAGQPLACPNCDKPASPLVSRTARITGVGEGEGGGGEDLDLSSADMDDFGHGHGHSHGPGGHTH
jgi:putative FmdB family regulatory protein